MAGSIEAKAIPKRNSEPTVQGFYRLVKANAYLKRMLAVVSGVSTVLALMITIGIGVLWVERASEGNRAQERWESTTFLHAVDARVALALKDEPAKALTRDQIHSALAGSGYATAEAVAELRAELAETRKSVEKMRLDLAQLVGELKAAKRP